MASDFPSDLTFEEDPARDDADPLSRLVLSLGGFDGPIDVLLVLARDQKVDLMHISILALADQYLLFVDAAAAQQLELAADYLVMAAWLAYLKSKLLLPKEENDDQPSAEDDDVIAIHELSFTPTSSPFQP